jgi:hypothetical protein
MACCGFPAVERVALATRDFAKVEAAAEAEVLPERVARLFHY